MDIDLHPTENVPEAVISSILRDYLKDPEAHLTNIILTPFSNSGASVNNSFYRADIEWVLSSSRIPASSTTWLIKSWKPGGLSLKELGWKAPIEALGWQHGILRPESLPAGIKTPIVGAVSDAGGEAAWIAMTDVSRDLREYDRAAPLPAERAVSHVKTILARLARFHAHWEQPDRQLFLEGIDWMLPLENYLRRHASTYAASLRQGVEADLDLQAFLEWLEPAERSRLEKLLVDRSQLVDRFAGISCTLLHGDLDDRNIGLSWSSTGESELVLIDWEWMGKGPAAMDVAKVMILMPLMCEPWNPCPEACFSDELIDYYYENYRMSGGRLLDQAAWRRSYDLALITQALEPFPNALGNILRALDGKAPLLDAPGLPAEVIRMFLASSLNTMKRMVDMIVQAMNRCSL